MLDASLLERIDERLRHWFEPALSFGGLGVICMGDFFQIAPVGKSLVHASFDDSSAAAGRLFREFVSTAFTQQMRAAEDVEWTRVLSFFRDPGASMFPVQASGVLELIRPLSSTDVREDLLWADAVIVTGANVTRFAINRAQIVRFARRVISPVICWRLRLETKTLTAFEFAAARNGKTVDALCNRYSAELVFCFVPGAPAFLSGFNLCTEKELTNNTSCTLHSLTLNTSCNPDATWDRIRAAHAGELVLIDRL